MRIRGGKVVRADILYYETLLGRFDEHTHTITGAPSLKKKC